MIIRRFCAVLTVVVATFALYGYVHAGDYAKLKKMDEISSQMAKERNQDINFYGKIIDFDGDHVAGAKVKMHVRTFGARSPQSAFKDINVTTDDNGLFSVNGFGELISLDDIYKDGYVYHYRYNRDRSRWSVKGRNRQNTGFEAGEPITFRVRKMAPQAFVLTGSWNFGLRAGGLKWLDLYQRDWTSPDRLSGKKLNDPEWKADISVSVEEDGENFKLILETVEKDSGFIVTKPEFIEEMTEAPERGYCPKLVVPITKNSSGHLFAYVKNEGGQFYSKIYINYANRANRDHVELDCGYFTNVSGERGLEFVPEIAQQYRDDANAGRRLRVKREQLSSGGVVMPVLGVE